MHWKSLLLLTLANYVMSFNENPIHIGKDHSHWKLIEKTYGPWTEEVTDTDYDVGEPLILTPFIENHKIEEARQAALVNDTLLLPGIKSYAGYLTVNKNFNANLWFWYFPVPSRPVSKSPLIIWLQGGPGASSLFGLFQEIGPFTAIDNDTLKENKYSWNKNHSLLFIDNPVGTGFSFTDDNGYARNQTTIGENLYVALQQFLTIFPELRKAPLFIMGESYAGKHIPSIAIQIHRHKEINPKERPINLQGLAIGNGFIDPITLLKHSYFLREVGIIEDQIADVVKSIEADVAKSIVEGKLEEAFLDLGLILNLMRKAGNLSDLYNYLSDSVELPSIYKNFVQRSKVRRAIHVGNTTFSYPFKVYGHLIPDFMNTAKPWLEELLNHYRILTFSGHLDCMVPYHASVNTYKSLKYSGALEYKYMNRFPWFHNGTLAGYYKTGGNLLEVMVRGAGHMVPSDKPAQALALITAFIQHITLESDTGNLI